MILNQLAQRTRQHGAIPLITHLDISLNSRIELSAKTFANWIDKTTSMIEGLGVDPGSPIGLVVSRERPDHWVSLVWLFAAWQFGSPVIFEPNEQTQLIVIGPDSPKAWGNAETVACSLHPWGAGFEQLPPTVTDYREVLIEPDTHWANPAPAEPFVGLGWEMLGQAPSNQRRLIANPTDPVEVIQILSGAIGGTGSLIIVKGDVDLDAVAAAEQVNG